MFASDCIRKKNETIQLVDINGQPIKDKGTALVKLELGSLNQFYPMLVVENPPCDVLIGSDYLNFYEFSICFEQKYIKSKIAGIINFEKCRKFKPILKISEPVKNTKKVVTFNNTINISEFECNEFILGKNRKSKPDWPMATKKEKQELRKNIYKIRVKEDTEIGPREKVQVNIYTQNEDVNKRYRLRPRKHVNYKC